MYEDLKDSLVTQGEDMLMRGRVETALRSEADIVGDDC